MNLDRAIAIVGMGCAFPNATSPQAFWDLVSQGKDTVSTVTADRWGLDPQKLHQAGEPAADRVYSLSGCFLDPEALNLDWDKLLIEPEAIAGLDPLFKTGLYAAQQAWLDAKTTNLDLKRVSVLIGNIVLPSETSSALTRETLGKAFENQILGDKSKVLAELTHANNRMAAGLPAGFIAKALGLGGGSATLDAACASSLYALAMACEALRSQRVDAVISGGLSKPDSLYTQMGFSQLKALSSKGFSTPFDHRADGLIVGEGAGFFVLKRLADALAQGDQIYGLIEGAGLSNDRDGSLLAPSSEGQLRAMREAYQEANWQPDQVSMIECHATGTPLGDRIEFESLCQLWQGSQPDRKAVIGSVKSNIGHLLTGAGAASLMKVLLAMQHQTLPPTARYEKPGTGIDLEQSPFRVLQKAEAWESKTPRKAGVSAFGFGGINAHVLVSQWEPDKQLKPSVPQESVSKEPIAIVGLAAQFGELTTQETLAKALLGIETPLPTALSTSGVAGTDHLKGYAIEKLDVPLGGFRIPPNELKEMLPQQLLMLDLARQVLQTSNLSEHVLEKAGVFLGIGLDPNTANFQLRWYLENSVEKWNQTLGLNLSDSQQQAWLVGLKEKLGPALNANRVIGALGGMVASRLAREFRVGGPSFTLSSEQTSGLAALEAAVRNLREQKINAAIVGAVDFACDIRSALGLTPDHQQPVCDGGGVILLKRLSDAKADGDAIMAIIEGVGVANRGGFQRLDEAKNAAFLAANKECRTSFDAENNNLQVLEHQFATQEQPLGQAGAAHGLKALLSAVYALHYRLLPENGKPQYWLRNSIAGPRRCWVDTLGDDGSVFGVHLVEAHPEVSPQPLVRPDNALFLIAATDSSELSALLGQLKEALIADSRGLSELAHDWWQARGKVAKFWRLGFLARTKASALERLQIVLNGLSAKPEAPEEDSAFAELLTKRKVFFKRQPMDDAEKIAFVFPGSGSQFPEMGRHLGLYFPHIFHGQDHLAQFNRDQMQPELFWRSHRAEVFHNQHRALLSAQVALGAVTHDLICAFGIKPKGIIGYSLGESSGLLATRAWTARDELHTNTQESNLFKNQLAGACDAARQVWQLPADQQVNWSLGVVDRPEEDVKAIIETHTRVYLLIVNTPKECVIGGDAGQVQEVVSALGARFFPLHGVVTVHCEVLEPASDAYYRHHLFETNAPKGMTYYSGGWGRQFEVTRESAAKAILAQARHGVHFPKTIRSAYEDGFRVFVEMGPGSSCTRMIGDILGPKPHKAISVSKPGPRAIRHLLTSMARLYTYGLPVDLAPLYQGLEPPAQTPEKPMMTIKVDREPKLAPPTPAPTTERNSVAMSAPSKSTSKSEVKVTQPAPVAFANTQTEKGPSLPSTQQAVLDGYAEVSQLSHKAHETFLQLSQMQTELLGQVAQFQMESFVQGDSQGHSFELPQNSTSIGQKPARADLKHSSAEIAPANSSMEVKPAPAPVAFDREACLEFARGSIAAVLGQEFAQVDQHPTRVRLPDEPLMLVDRILEVSGTRMTSGRVVTEHDVKENGWYLDGGRIPTCVAVEAGQADLFLSAYLGIDFETKGHAVYRLLDAEVTFHDDLPQAGKVIHYDIHIDHFFRQGKTYLFRFRFDGTVDGKPLLTMRNGCAGFFSEAELDAGKGIVGRKAPLNASVQRVEPLVPMVVEAYDDDQIKALRKGDLAACFGPQFATIPLNRPMTLPDGVMNLVDRVLVLEPNGGPNGLGFIRAEADIHPDDWFLTCHFVDDKVMPGTLMYECCLHSLRIFLLRMGWIGEEDQVSYQPVKGVKSRLKCRGQVLETTKKVRYEVLIKSLGYGPEPFAVVDALMYSDEKCIVEIGDMSIRLSGLTQAAVEGLWSGQAQAQTGTTSVVKPALYDSNSILAFAVGKPSEAFGKPYEVFDEQRIIARLPGPPFMLTDRITDIQTPPWKVQAGGSVQAQYDVPEDAWYFHENQQAIMPFAVLLEIALQPCGWMAAYMGSALTSDEDLKFRNLGGKAVMHRGVTASTGTLTIDIDATKVSASGGMIIQNFNFAVSDQHGPVYTGDTYFGFFSKEALAKQVGLRNQPVKPENLSDIADAFAYPEGGPYPDARMRMLDRVVHFDAKGGDKDLGLIIGEMDVDSSSWFFKAHFHQDPVVPGSLGLESFLQLLKVMAVKRWQLDAETEFETVACDQQHHWEYRGQVIPSNNTVKVYAELTGIDDAEKVLIAKGVLSVDGIPIYSMKDFSLRVC